jgi:hypothetical protein
MAREVSNNRSVNYGIAMRCLETAGVDCELPLMTAAIAAKLSGNSLILLVGAPEGIRTPDLCLRRAALYPAELRARR